MNTRPARRTTALAALALTAGMIAALPATLTGCASSAARADGDNTTLEEYRRIEADLIRRARRLTARGDRAFADDNTDQAVQLYLDALTVYDRFASAWNNLGVALMARGDAAEAESAFVNAARLAPDDYRPVFNRGLLYYERGFVRQARNVFRQAVAIDNAQLAPVWYAIRADLLLSEFDQQTVTNIDRALLLEDDPRYIQRLRLERQRIRRILEEQREDDALPGQLPDDRAIDILEDFQSDGSSGGSSGGSSAGSSQELPGSPLDGRPADEQPVQQPLLFDNDPAPGADEPHADPTPSGNRNEPDEG